MTAPTLRPAAPPLARPAQVPAAPRSTAGAPPAASGELGEQIAAAEAWFAQERFAGITRLHTARDVAEQQGTLQTDHARVRDTAEAFHARLRALFVAHGRISTFGPYSPGQAVVMKRHGIEGIYLGGWATSAKGSLDEDPGPDLASYPLSAVPDEAAGIVRALATADRNQHFTRSHLSAEERAAAPAIDFRPFIIADADTGHGGDAHVRNLIRRFVEVGVPGYHIEDQRAGAKKCGHQDGKVLVAQHEQNKRLNAARLQLDVMRVPGIIVARTDAESATLLDDISDERDQPFVLGATQRDIPTYRTAHLAILRRLHEAGLDDARGHLLFAVPRSELEAAMAWLTRTGLAALVDDAARDALAASPPPHLDDVIESIEVRFVETWAADAGIMTLAEAVEAARIAAGHGKASIDAAPVAAGESFHDLRRIATAAGLDVHWDPEAARTPDGFYRVRGGIDYAIAKSLAAAPFADLLWMETKTADLADARRFAEAVHVVFPDKMLAYNLSPSFNWDTTGMTDDEMRRFPDELGRLGYVFDFITYGGHQIDGLAAEEFSAALQRDGMLALARLQRRLRLIESPYRGPQALVGGDRLDASLMAASGRTASTKAMGAASTHRQHLVRTEMPPSALEDWLAEAGLPDVRVRLRPSEPWSDRTDLTLHRREDERELVRLTSTIIDGGADGSALLLLEATIAFDAPEPASTMATLYLLARSGATRMHDLRPGAHSDGLLRRLDEAGIAVDGNATEGGHHGPIHVDRTRVAALAADDVAGRAGRERALTMEPAAG